MDWIELMVSLSTLTILEIVLGVDNLVLLTVLTHQLPSQQRKKAQYWGLTFAWVTRLMLLASAVWIAKLKTPIFQAFGVSFSWRGLFLLVGGLFLLFKATEEIRKLVLKQDISERPRSSWKAQFWTIVIQIGLLDIIFSLDSVLTAVGLTEHFGVMAAAISIAILVMVFAADAVGRFIEAYPTLKMLALAFLLLIGMVLVADGFSFHIPRGYIYFSMAFSLLIEALNILSRKHLS